jgi:uncharacterized protein (DUF58 family)
VTALDASFLRTLAGLELAVARLRAGSGDGARRADRRGGRVEFADRRPYAPGDDVRSLDWAAHARTGRLWVKEYERREDVEALVLVDTSASMGLHGKLDRALRIAWALAAVALRTDGSARVGLCADGRLDLSARAHGPGGVAVLGRVLARAVPAGRTGLAASLRLVPTARRGSRAVVLVSDLLAEDDGREALALLARRGDEVSVVHVVAAGDCAVAGGPGAVLEDAESRERVVLTDDAARRAARWAVDREESWRRFSVRHRLHYVPVDAAAPLDASVVRALRAGGVLA